MHLVYLFLFVAGLFPFLIAWQRNRGWTLVHALVWALAAWLAWGFALLVGEPARTGLDPWRYVALCLTAAAGVAVLGARRPQVAAWNFVVLGLLAVMLLPLGESFFLGTPSLDGLRIFFLGAILAVGILNYLPTRHFASALFLGVICCLEGAVLFRGDPIGEGVHIEVVHLGLLLGPWLVLACSLLRRRNGGEIDRAWHSFRDRYGLFWAQRIREQFNRGAAHAGLPGYLSWKGWRSEKEAPLACVQEKRLLQMLHAALKRFEPV